MDTDAGRPTRYASWGRRLAALLIDGVIVTVVCLVPILLIILAAEDEDDIAAAVIWPAIAFLIVFPAVYHTVLVALTGQTLGKRMLGIAVRDAEQEGAAIGYGRAFGRWFVAYVLWTLCYVPGILDGLWPLWDDRKQSLHDKAVRSVVVHT
jgi:uncharacterized RDD family membrane protein YckC